MPVVEGSAAPSDREGSGGLHDFSGTKTARADANPPDAAIHDCSYRLEVRLEPPRADVVSVADLPAHHRTFSANLTPLRHVTSPQSSIQIFKFYWLTYGTIKRGASV